MLYYASPESQGIPSSILYTYLDTLEAYHLPIHSILISRGDKLVLEAYYPPFQKGIPHRLYSVTKSFVTLAAGFAMQDGYFSLDDCVAQYFPEETIGQTDPHLLQQTIRNMLMMCTALPESNWFSVKPADRVQYYFQDPRRNSCAPGTRFAYDSTGTFIIGALIERKTGKKLLPYLREKLLDPLGVSPSPRALSCPGGHTWSDSAFLMAPTDLWKVARFVMNGGCWQGKQLLSREFIREATSALVPTHEKEGIEGQGYGYYIWKAYGEGFFFNGMGSQLALCVPEKDMVLICNADTQGIAHDKSMILDSFYHIVVKNAGGPLPYNTQDTELLAKKIQNLSLFAAYGEDTQPITQCINGKTYKMDTNPMEIEYCRFDFSRKGGTFSYTHIQGTKSLPFGMRNNVFVNFPQEGYADQIATIPGHRLYRSAVSAAWKDSHTLWIKVQIIDDYLGNMDIYCTFSPDGNHLHLLMRKAAEDFLCEYEGEAFGRAMYSKE